MSHVHAEVEKNSKAATELKFEMDIVLSTSYFPSIEYIACHYLASNTFIEKHETYPKQTLRNRCNIATSQGIQSLIIPVVKKDGPNTPIDRIEIMPNSDFKKQHLKAIKTAYHSAPFFEHYIDFIQDCLNVQELNLINYNCLIFNKICKLIHLKQSYFFTSEFNKETINKKDLRLSLCSKNAVTKFSNIKHSTLENRYSQVFVEKQGFIKNLSIIDLIMNEGPMSEIYIKKFQFSE